MTDFNTLINLFTVKIDEFLTNLSTPDYQEPDLPCDLALFERSS